MAASGNDTACLITLRATPLGHVSAEWLLPLALLPGGNQFVLPLINFKYVISEVLKIPVPLSDKAVEILTEVTKCEMVNATNDVASAVPWREETDFLLNKNILIDVPRDKSSFTSLLLRFVSKNLVSNDGLFFKVVYPIVNTLDNPLTVKVEFTAHFSYGIRKFRFYYYASTQLQAKCCNELLILTLR